MKKSFLLITGFFAAICLQAQDQTLFSHIGRSGVWGAPLFEYSDLSNDVQVGSGGGGALVFNDFYLGGYGMGNVEFLKLQPAANLRERVKFKHGGFWLGYTPLQSRVLHPYSSVKFGWGKARYRSTTFDNPETVLSELEDNIFVLTPELGFEVNVFSWFRIATTGAYRLVSGLGDVPSFEDDDLSEFTLQLTLRFGDFGRDRSRDKHRDRWD